MEIVRTKSSSAPTGRIPDGRKNDDASPSAGKQVVKKNKKCLLPSATSEIRCSVYQAGAGRQDASDEKRASTRPIMPPFLPKVSVCVDPLDAWNANSSVEQPAHK